MNKSRNDQTINEDLRQDRELYLKDSGINFNAAPSSELPPVPDEFRDPCSNPF